ncbi:competence type IV pilus minor pilin ComGD [Streptococcus loxodontisalivarius]|uniref:Competence protein ComGD n=1 Tax=Streptococcus loxodontisalivarius TaxID=1349415 RepID=A0ABS2PTL1_9STRE|nr:competence type IV pilus minor pilin ComGD [Streptococcus loxodontisalivarius]MBM7643377.1 competence protein ComGD [Streptococcus loxodontisalivarius]
MRRIRAVRLHKLPTRAFTLLESLLTLSTVSFLLLILTGSVRTSFRQVEENLFLLHFEHLYRENQQLSIAGQREVSLSLTEDAIKSDLQTIELPKGVTIAKPIKLVFSKEGGNSSLAKVDFQLSDRKVHYQLNLGSGKYRKTED